MSESLPALSEVESCIQRLAFGINASELHGGLCGWIAGGGDLTPDWPGRILVDSGLAPVIAGGVLDRLGRASVEQLEDRDFGLELLLQPGQAPLTVRSGALFDWCRGFLGGFGLAAGNAPPLSAEAQEVLTDLARLAAATAQDEGDEEDEAALAEIEEFVRVAALLLHGDCVLAARHRQQFN